MSATGSVRLDAWVWAIRLFKSRSQATTACRGGHVRVNGRPAKPATTLAIGDRVQVSGGERERIVEVRALIAKRVSAAAAAECFIDHSPPPPVRQAPVAQRERGAGRPTKRDRRQLDRLRGRR